MALHGACRHVRAGQPAAPRAMAGAPVPAPRAPVSGADELRDDAARPRDRARVGEPPRRRRAGRAVAGPTPISLREANRIARVLDRGSRPRARQSRAAARAEQPDARGVLVRGDEGRRDRGRQRCRCCARRSSPTSSPRRRSRTRSAIIVSPPSSTPPARNCPTLENVAMFGTTSGRDGLDARAARQAARRSPTSTPPPRIRRSSRSPRARPASRRGRCTFIAT